MRAATKESLISGCLTFGRGRFHRVSIFGCKNREALWLGEGAGIGWL